MITRVNVAFVQPISDLGGNTHYFLITLRHWDPTAYRSFFVASGNGPAFAEAKKLGVECASLPTEYNLWSFFRSLRVAVAWTRKENIAIIYAHPLKAGFLFAAAKPFSRFRLVYCGHGWRFTQKDSRIKKIIFYFFDLFTCAMADAVIVESEKQKNEALRFKLCPPRKIRIVRTRLDLPGVAPARRKEYPVVMTVGRITHQKDPIGFLSIASRVLKKHPNTKFVWVGDGDMKEALIAEARRLGIDKNLSVTGQLPQKDVITALGGADVFLLTSFMEGLPATLLEAMAVGVPVVAANVGSVSEVVIPNETGSLYVPPDYDAAANAVLAALTLPPEEKSKLTKRALSFVEKDFAPESGLAKETMEVFRSIS